MNGEKKDENMTPMCVSVTYLLFWNFYNILRSFCQSEIWELEVALDMI